MSDWPSPDPDVERRNAELDLDGERLRIQADTAVREREERDERDRLRLLISEIEGLSENDYELRRWAIAQREHVREEFLDNLRKQAKRSPRESRKQARQARPPEYEAPAPHEPKEVPFQVLGTADDGQVYFIDEPGRLKAFRPSGLTKGMLIDLAPLPWWYREFGHKGKVEWDSAIDFVVRESSYRDFDLTRVRGRGAWRDGDGIVYHDGQVVYGARGHEYIYQKKARLHLGLEGDPASTDGRARMRKAAERLSFETQADCARLLAWSALAPFCGALPWRPAGFITGPSKSGKTTVLDLLVTRLVLPEYVSGSDSTGAGIRQDMGNDALPVVIDEAEGDDETVSRRMTEILALMRQSTSDNAPKIVKGSTSGKSVSYSTRSMYLYAAISPNVKRSADQNRLFVVDLVKPDNDWASIKTELAAAFTPEACAGVRVYTWSVLPQIIADAERMADAVQDVTTLDTRYALQEGILWAAYWWVWVGRSPDDEKLRSFLESVYKQKAPEEQEDDAETMLQRLFDEVVQVSGKPAERIRIGKVLDRMTGQRDDDSDMFVAPMDDNDRRCYKTTLENYGLRLTRERELAIAVRNPQLEKIWAQKGYAKILSRHVMCVDRNRNVRQARSVVLSATVLSKEEIPI